ncbi:unnamed protein product [Effrenium voratum]|nr:unnamed protein product [Effrenium voratum]
MRLVLVPVLLAMFGAVWAEGDEGLEEHTDLEQNELEEIDVEGDEVEEPDPALEEEKGKMSSHPLYQDCLTHAESVESEHGLYDGPEVKGDADLRVKMAKSLKAKGDELTKKESATFESAFIKALEGVASSDGNFGATDACDYLLQHYETEL